MRRRSVIAGLAALFLAPIRSVAQQSQVKIPRVGILTQAPNGRAPMFDAFREGLRDLGYIGAHGPSRSRRHVDKACSRILPVVSP